MALLADFPVGIVPVAPTPGPLTNGYRTLISFDLLPTVQLFQKAVTPPSLDFGEGNDITTMHNNDCFTKAPAALVEWGPASVRAAYNPDVYSTILTTLIGQNGVVAVTFPNAFQILFWGFLRRFAPDRLQNRQQPEADVEIVVTNYDDVNCVEECPILFGGVGTC